MTSASVETKLIEADDNAFINSLVSEGHQEVYFRGWVDLFYEDKKSKKRILVVSSFRVYTIKVNMLGRSLRQQFPIRDLTLLKATEGRLHLEFANISQPAVIEHPEIIHIAQSVLFAYQSISLGRPKEELAKIEIAPVFLQDYLPPEPDSQDALLASYLCECEYVGTPQRVPVLDHLMTAFQMNHHTLNLDECLSCLGSDTPTKDVQALVAALRSSDWFSELTALGGVQLKNEGVAAVAPLLSQPSSLHKLALINVKGGKSGFSSLATSLSKGVHSLTYLNISHNKFEDSGLQTIVQGLEESKKALHTLSLRNCGVSGKGLQSLCALLGKANWAKELKVLDIGENRAAKAGSQALAQWLTNDQLSIEQLHLSSCELDLEILLPALSQNPKLYDGNLKSVDLSGNKLTKKASAAASALLATSGSLSQLQFSNCSLERAGFAALLDAAFANERGLRFSLDFSHNELGVKGARDLSEVYMRWLKKDMTARAASGSGSGSGSAAPSHGSIHTLNLSECGLGVEGVVAVCKALSGTSINTLALDCNLKLGLFTSGKEAGEALAALVKNTPALKELSVAGDGNSHALKGGVSGLVAALAHGCSLAHLDISKNRIGDEGAKELAESLAQNSSLTSLHVDHNRLSIKGIRLIHSGLTKNKTLEDWILPVDDLMKIVKSLPDKKIREVQSIVTELEMMMDRNAEHNASLREKEKAESKEKDKHDSYNGYCSMRGTRQWLLLSLSPAFQHHLYSQHGVRQAAAGRSVRAASLAKAIEQAINKKSQGGLELLSDAMMGGGGAGGRFEFDDDQDQEDDEDDEEFQEHKEKQNTAIAISASSPTSSSSVAPPFPSPLSPPSSSPSSSTSSSSPPAVPALPALPPPLPHSASFSSSAPASPPHALVGLGSPAALSAPKPAGFSAPVISLRKTHDAAEAKGGSFADWKNTSFPAASLKGSSLPASVDPAVRELYLSDADFSAVFGMNKNEFLAMPKWKQAKAKQQHGLF